MSASVSHSSVRQRQEHDAAGQPDFLDRNNGVSRKGAGRQAVSDKKDWGTPIKYIRAVKEVFDGNIDLDPCSNDHSVVGAHVAYRLPTDGLKASWDFPKIYVNPPYGNDKARGTTIRHWLERCAHAHEVHGSDVLSLVPVAVNTLHWKRHVFTKARAVCFLYDTRLRFLENGQDIGKGAPMACAMIYWGEDYAAFRRVFMAHGAVVDLSQLWGEKVGTGRQQDSLPR